MVHMVCPECRSSFEPGLWSIGGATCPACGRQRVVPTVIPWTQTPVFRLFVLVAALWVAMLAIIAAAALLAR